MYGELTWYSSSRKRVVRIAVNGGSVCYDKIGIGFERVPEPKRMQVITQLLNIDEQLEKIFLNDMYVQTL